ncbi:tRNA threonylcarbamoyladenosine dehydratase [Carboxylicivirga marina]|uniref:tRNA threonylcarbamoyladenosine dehydratase n=1 Tax=Carboxylicivirga marina TaxID=2800988 RepID=A0ABS1HNQ8_9BACT|nr:tRNA threonylcarbamoyladenosine dehydratase [Carboxylicivirga marina]MBK3519321.1 tRNA threonylcarbamoyladenosine dehydratase [Carboxylicivirga marina]
MGKGIFHRSELLMGKAVMNSLADKKVILFGIGGVGSWCAESLIRTGITQLTIVDSDRVCVTNVNRQLMATSKTVGQVKTEALKERLLEINPKAEITALQKIYSKETSEDFDLDRYDVIIDAIDSLASKVHLIQRATDTEAIFVSSMGAALKMDPTRIKVDSFWNVQGCPLARKIRKMVRKVGEPARDFLCVYSDELLENVGADATCGTEKCLCPKAENGPGDPDLVNHEWCSLKAAINGSLAHITGIYGFTLAGLVIKEINKTITVA